MPRPKQGHSNNANRWAGIYHQEQNKRRKRVDMKLKYRPLFSVLAIGTAIEIISLITKLSLGRWVMFGIGLVYSLLAYRKEQKTYKSGVLGGMIAGTSLGVINILITVVYVSLYAPSIADYLQQMASNPHPVVSIGFIGGLIRGLVGEIIMAGFVGALGGAIGISLARKKHDLNHKSNDKTSIMMNKNFRNQIFNTLNQKETSELVEIWQKNDRIEWSEEAFLVIQEILQSRLRHLPLQNPPIYESIDQVEENKEDDCYDQRIKDFSEAKNIDGLVDILKNEPDPISRLEAAEALAKLDDERGLDYLIDALEFDDINISYDAEEILSELNLPKGVLALHSHLLDHNRTIYSKTDTPSSEKDYVIAYVSIIF